VAPTPWADVRARAVLTVERGSDGRSIVRELRSQSPLSLIPRRGTGAAQEQAVTVHMIGSASTPLAGDDVGLDVRVGPGAELVLTGVAAAVALPGATGPSNLTVRFDVGEGASLQYLPEPTVVTARADHRTRLHVELHPTARLRCREVLVAGRTGEAAGRFSGTTRVTERIGPDVAPLLMQTQELDLAARAAHLAGHRVLATEILVWDDDPRAAAAGDWWSLAPLPRRGCLATALGPDAVSVARELAGAVRAHPGWVRSCAAGRGR
jgi:urease accessory protein